MLSWREKMPDYKIVILNEMNCDIEKPIVREFLKRKQWAFASDYIRLVTLYEHGGIYFDTDIEVVKSFDQLLDKSCFLGFEAEDRPNTAVLGCERKHPFIRLCIEEMERIFDYGQPYRIAPEIAKTAYDKFLNSKNETPLYIFKSDYFYPYNPYESSREIHQLMYRDIKECTFAIHHWSKSWSMPFHEKIRRKLFG